MYQSKIHMSRFRDYSDLFPGSGEFDIPANLKIGLTWHARDNLAFSIDAEQIFHTGVDALGNSLDDLFRCPTANRGGDDLTAGFDVLDAVVDATAVWSRRHARCPESFNCQII